MTVDVLYIVSTLRRSGPTNQLYYVLDHLDEDVDATVLTLSPEPEDSEFPRFRDLPVDCETLGLSRIDGVLVGPSRLRSFVSAREPDVIHTQGLRADTLAAVFLSGYPHVVTVRNYPYDDYPSKFGPVSGWVMALEHTRVLGRVDHPVACSETIAAVIEPHGIDATPIQNGVDTEAYAPASDSDVDDLRTDLDLPKEGDVYVSVGSLIPRKAPQTVVRGFQRSVVSEDGLLLVLGDGRLREECEELASDSVRFVGWVDDVESYLQASDYFVSASRSEGLPNSVMEALATGLPVCLSDIDPHREILRESDAGTLFPTDDPDSVARALDALSTDDYSSKSATARRIAEERLSAERMSGRYQELYRSIANEAASART